MSAAARPPRTTRASKWRSAITRSASATSVVCSSTSSLPAETADRDIIHSAAIGYTVDGTPVRDARGMFGERLGVDVHLVTAASGAMRNLQVCVRRAHLEIADRVVAAHAAGLSSLVSDERDLGVTLIDMGGGTTSIAVFYEGHLVHVDSIPVGGEHVTRDIARGLSTPVAHAERMKTQIGRAVAKPNDEYDIIDVPLIGEEDRTRPNHIPRSILVGIIRPRVEETFELVRSRLEASAVWISWPVDAPFWSVAAANSTACPRSRLRFSTRRSAPARRCVWRDSRIRLAGLRFPQRPDCFPSRSSITPSRRPNRRRAKHRRVELVGLAVGLEKTFRQYVVWDEANPQQAIDKRQEKAGGGEGSFLKRRPRRYSEQIPPSFAWRKPNDNQPQSPPEGVGD